MYAGSVNSFCNRIRLYSSYSHRVSCIPKGAGLYQRMLVDILLYRVLIAFRYRYVFVAHYYA